MHDTAIGTPSVRFGSVARQRLSEALEDRDKIGFHSIAAFHSNVKAIEACLLLSGGLQTHVAIMGPSGWGKTHLLHSTAKSISRNRGVPIQVWSAQELSNSSRLDAQMPLILDDVHEAIHRSKLRQQLRSILERRVRAGLTTLLGFDNEHGTRAIKAFLPCPREWTTAAIGEPSSDERALVVRQLANTQGLILGTPLLNSLARRTTGNGRTLTGALQRLKLIQTRWTEPAEVLRSLGVLKDYWGDSQGWDLRDFIIERVNASVDGELEARDLAVYVMLHSIGLSESETAKALGLHPGEAYAIGVKMELALKDHLAISAAVKTIEANLYQSL